MKTNLFLRLGLLAAMMVVLAMACSRSTYSGYDKTDSGIYIKYHQKGEEGAKPQINDVVAVSMIYELSDTVLFHSDSLTEPLRFPVIEPTFQGDLYAALSLMNIGDSISIVFPADSFYVATAGLETLPEFVQAGEPMYFHVKLNSFQTEAELLAEQHMMLEQMKTLEQNTLGAFIEENQSKIIQKPSGLILLEEKAGKGSFPNQGDVLKLNFSVGTIDGQMLFSTFDRNEPMDVTFGEQFDTPGFDEGIGYIKKGGRSKLIVPSNLAFDSMGRGQIVAPYTTLVYDIEVLNIRSKEEVARENEQKVKEESAKAEKAKQAEADKISSYLKLNGITVQPVASGLYYVEIEAGTGAQAAAGKEVNVHYTLYNIEGKKLQSSLDAGQPFKFTLGQGQVIQGWDEGIAMMKAGGKAKLILPSSLAYGATQRGEDIPPYSPLVFEVQLIDVAE